MTRRLLGQLAFQILLGLKFHIIYVLDLVAQLLGRNRLRVLRLVNSTRRGVDQLVLLVVNRGFLCGVIGTRLPRALLYPTVIVFVLLIW